jgi:outer membrane protein assembly factor BamB
LYALDAANGQLKWKFDAGGMIVSTPLVMDGKVYFGALHKFFALDAATGQQVWQFVSPETNDWIWSDPTSQGGVVYFGTLGNRVYALDAATGNARWAQPFVAGGQVRSSIILDNGTGYFGASDQKVYALNLENAQLKWNPIPVTGPVLASPAVEGDTLFVPTHGYNMYAFNTTDGARRWCFDANSNAACTN